MRLRWLRKNEEVIDLADPTLRQIARLGYALGIRFYFNLKPDEPQLPGMEEY